MIDQIEINKWFAQHGEIVTTADGIEHIYATLPEPDGRRVILAIDPRGRSAQVVEQHRNVARRAIYKKYMETVRLRKHVIRIPLFSR